MVDFRNPEHFFHDVNSVAGALKQFLRDLPDPLMTHEQYTAFIEAARESLSLSLSLSLARGAQPRTISCTVANLLWTCLGSTGVEDEVVRRDSLHAVINSLPDPNYATLRALTLVCIKSFRVFRWRAYD